MNFPSDNLVLLARNDKGFNDSATSIISSLRMLMDRVARHAAKANRDWHDDTGADDHAMFHAPDKQPIACINRNGLFCSVSSMKNGRLWFMHPGDSLEDQFMLSAVRLPYRKWVCKEAIEGLFN